MAQARRVRDRTRLRVNYLDRWLAWQGNPRLKVGDVKQKDADTIVADIVTKDNSLLQRFVVNRRNGFFQPSEE
jgi:hypothetical protein